MPAPWQGNPQPMPGPGLANGGVPLTSSPLMPSPVAPAGTAAPAMNPMMMGANGMAGLPNLAALSALRPDLMGAR
jgi:hypothetical protein